jgi:hypothetical protein
MSPCYDITLNPMIAPFVVDLRSVLGKDLAGLYLYGSSVSGGFDDGVSDVDLVAVVEPAVEELDIPALEAVHGRVAYRDPRWVDRLEIVYVARATVGGIVGRDRVAVISPAEPFHVSGPASDWLQNWYLVRETGVALLGPPPTALFRPISKADFLGAVRAYLQYLRGADALGYAVLSACRALCTLETRNACSKQEGAAWARDHLPEWAWLVDVALADRLSGGKRGFKEARTRVEARRFLNLAAALVPPQANPSGSR